MAQEFIQPTALTPVQGEMGNQTIVQNQEPGLDQLMKPTLQLADMAGDMYSESKAKSLVKEEIENVDAARAAAESGQFTSGDPVPEGLKVDQKEWDMLAGAVQSGSMSRESARLIASSRLRSRIAEEPLFANRMRKAASGVLGFNIESEGAQQYFNSFATKGQIASSQQDSQNKDILKMKQEAEEEARLTGIPAEKIYRQKWALITSERNKEVAMLEKEQGLRTDKEAFTAFNKENSKTAFTGVLGQLRTTFNEEGSVKPEVYTQKLVDAKQQELAELTALWEGDQTGSEFSSARQVIEDRYDTYQTILESVDYDKLNQITVDRNSNERTLFTDEMMNDVKMINEGAGQEGVKAYFNYISPLTNPTQKAQLMEQYPLLKRFVELEGMGPEEVSKKLGKTAAKVINREPLEEEDEPTADPVITSLHDDAETEEEQTSIFDYLVENGLKLKSLSLVARKSPGKTSVDNAKNTKTAYEKELTPLLKSLGREVEEWASDVNRFGIPAVEMVVNEAGDIQVSSTRPLSLPQGKLAELQRGANYINQFNKLHKNDWGRVLGEDKSAYDLKVQKFLEEGKKEQVFSGQTDFIEAAVAGKEGAAEKSYLKLQENYPEDFPKPFSELYEEIRRRRIEQESE